MQTLKVLTKNHPVKLVLFEQISTSFSIKDTEFSHLWYSSFALPVDISSWDNVCSKSSLGEWHSTQFTKDAATRELINCWWWYWEGFKIAFNKVVFPVDDPPLMRIDEGGDYINEKVCFFLFCFQKEQKRKNGRGQWNMKIWIFWGLGWFYIARYICTKRIWWNFANIYR